MAVQTQINRISSEVSNQASLISQIAAALEGKAGGSSSDSGTSIETCTVNVTGSSNSALQFYASRLVDGEEDHSGGASLESLVLSDVILGRLWVLYSEENAATMGHSIITSDNVVLISRSVVEGGGSVSSYICTSGTTATITLTAIGSTEPT